MEVSAAGFGVSCFRVWGPVNGHVDNFCCFVRPGVVLLAWTDDQDDPQYEVSMDAFKRLSCATDAKGRKLEIIKLPRPPPLFRSFKEANGLAEGYIEKGYVPRIAGERLPSMYINHYCAEKRALETSALSRSSKKSTGDRIRIRTRMSFLRRSGRLRS